MPELQIFCSLSVEGDALKLLQEGARPHKLIFSQKAGKSILVQTGSDPAFAGVDVAVGQPDVGDVLASTRLRWVHLTSAGYTRYDTSEFRAAAKAKGIQVTNSSMVYTEPCAEQILSFMLGQARLLPQSLGVQCDNTTSEWARIRYSLRCLQHKSVVILGFGSIGIRLIELLAPFQMKITAVRRQAKGDEGVSIVSPDDCQKALAEADHVVNILPDNPASRHFMSADRFGWMKPGAMFYNIGRGTTVDQHALVAVLKSGHLGAAWLDVTDPEPLPVGHPLLSAPNCFITPHTGGGHQNEPESLVRHFLENLQRFVKDSPLLDRIM
jgi:phosphoglycerate dehydrogenase-like enzyme